jgi:hypothetical protein
MLLKKGKRMMKIYFKFYESAKETSEEDSPVG